MVLLYDTYRGNDRLKASPYTMRRWTREYYELLKYMSADVRDLLVDGVYARVYLNGSDLIIESEECGGAVQYDRTGKRLAFDPHYTVTTIALTDAKRQIWS